MIKKTIIESEKRTNQNITRLGDILQNEDVYHRKIASLDDYEIPVELLDETKTNLYVYHSNLKTNHPIYLYKGVSLDSYRVFESIRNGSW